jgi:hypothetical protein
MSPLYEMAQQGIDLKTVTWAAHSDSFQRSAFSKMGCWLTADR